MKPGTVSITKHKNINFNSARLTGLHSNCWYFSCQNQNSWDKCALVGPCPHLFHPLSPKQNAPNKTLICNLKGVADNDIVAIWLRSSLGLGSTSQGKGRAPFYILLCKFGLCLWVIILIWLCVSLTEKKHHLVFNLCSAHSLAITLVRLYGYSFQYCQTMQLMTCLGVTISFP